MKKLYSKLLWSRVSAKGHQIYSLFYSLKIVGLDKQLPIQEMKPKRFNDHH